MSHLMVDIETLGTDNNARILSVGIVEFDETNTLETCYYVVDQTTAKGIIDFDTVKWWLGQSDKAKQVFYEKDTLSEQTLAALLIDRYITQRHIETIWANSPNFDIVILNNLLRRHAHKQFAFYKLRDYRTMKAMFPLASAPIPIIAHNALDDAVCQVQVLQAILKQYNIQLR